MRTRRITALASILSTIIICGCGKVNMEHEEAKNLEIINIDFKDLSKGEYKGYYAGGMHGWRENECLVYVDSINKDSCRVNKIELISSTEDRPQAFFNELYGRVINKQSLQVDAIGGATLTSKAHLKAIEDALIKSEQQISDNK